jgi:hypothetical protein
MECDKRVSTILDEAQAGHAPVKEDCSYLLGFYEASVEAAFLRAISDSIARRRFGNEGIILGQMGEPSDFSGAAATGFSNRVRGKLPVVIVTGRLPLLIILPIIRLLGSRADRPLSLCTCFQWRL